MRTSQQSKRLRPALLYRTRDFYHRHEIATQRRKTDGVRIVFEQLVSDLAVNRTVEDQATLVHLQHRVVKRRDMLRSLNFGDERDQSKVRVKIILGR